MTKDLNKTKPSRNDSVNTTEDLYTETPVFSQTGFVRNQEEMDWDYTPDGDLEISEELKQWFAEQGATLRWVRHSKDEKLDAKNIAKNKKKGYEFVKIEQIPLHLREKFENPNALDGFEGFVTYEDLVLMATPTWKHEIVKARIEDKATRQLKMVDDLLRKETSRSGLDTNSDALNLINNSQVSRVKVGGKREVSYAKK